MSKKIKDKIIVITGAMGEAAAKHLSGLGATVVLGARRTDRIEKLAKEINNNGGKVLTIATDVTKRKQVKKLVDTANNKVLKAIQNAKPIYGQISSNVFSYTRPLAQ